jgi:hypothetical protein
MKGESMKTKTNFKFKYIFSDNYNPIYVNGAYGGINSKAEIVVHFFLERTALPNSITHEVNEDGTLGTEIEIEPKDHGTSLVRFISTGIIINLEQAKTIHKWLGEKIGTLERLLKIQSEKSIKKIKREGKPNGRNK